MSNCQYVHLGTRNVPIPEQRVGRVLNRMGAIIELLAGVEGRKDMAPAQLVMAVGGDGLYGLLELLIPKLPQALPEWEFRGYASREAWEAGEYDDDEELSPTTNELLNAIAVSLEVNGLYRLAEEMRKGGPPQTAEVSLTSATSPAANGGSPVSISSSTTPPTSN